MTMKTRPFTSIVRAALALTRVETLLSTAEAVILERISYGGGATKWYYCCNSIQLETIEAEFSPGSAVSFYFDDRIRNVIYSSKLIPELEEIINKTGDVIFGLLREDGLHIDVEYVDNPQELAEITSSIDNKARVFYGAFPARDNDGAHAVSLVLPDEDGIVTSHPH